MDPLPLDRPGASILVVDDHPDNLRLLTDLLSNQGYEVRCAPTGSLALANIARAQPDLILLDIMMPGLDGYQVCQQLRADTKTCHIPIIFLSALGEAFDKVRAFEVGGDDYVTKPFQIEEVSARVRHHLRTQWLQRQLQDREAELNYLVEIRTAQLQQSLQFESLLRTISDRVRSTLDETQILRTVVQELGRALQTIRCDIGLYDPDHTVSTIQYEYSALSQSAIGTQFPFGQRRQIYHQLSQGEYVHFCPVDSPRPLDHRSFAKLICPISDDQGILGDLCLCRSGEQVFLEQEINLVHQIATQCAITIRQARLFQASQNQVRQLEKINQLKDEFVATVSHELRTPLTNMNMAIKMLGVSQQQFPLDPKQQRYLETLEQECNREIQLVNDLLDLQKLEKRNQRLSPTRLSLPDWLSQSLTPFQDQFQQRHLILVTNVQPDLPVIETDVALLDRVIKELLTNACKHTPPDHEIQVQIRHRLEQNIIEIDLINTGVEIPVAECASIFDKFYRVSTDDPWRKGGTGLGLALVKQAMEQLGGSITAESLNQSTRFRLRLPLTLAQGRQR